MQGYTDRASGRVGGEPLPRPGVSRNCAGAVISLPTVASMLEVSASRSTDDCPEQSVAEVLRERIGSNPPDFEPKTGIQTLVMGQIDTRQSPQAGTRRLLQMSLSRPATSATGC